MRSQPSEMRGDLNPTLMPGIPTVTPHNVHQQGRNFDDDENERRKGTGAGAHSLDDVKSYIHSLEAERQKSLAAKVVDPGFSDSGELESVPPQQLIRELAFLKDCVHENITTFHGAFMSTPDSERGVEVCVLMEFCDGELL